MCSRIALASLALLLVPGCSDQAGGSAPNDAGAEAAAPDANPIEASTDGGAEGSSDAGAGACTIDADCPAVAGEPDGCAVATCVDHACVYVTRDDDADGYRSMTCLLTDAPAGITFEVGDDCDDANPEVHPKVWDGPEGHGATGEAVPDRCNKRDDDCNGLVDDGKTDNASCHCAAGDQFECHATSDGKPIRYPMGADIGACKAGTQSCADGVWGPCYGAGFPTEELCNNDIDDDCNGKVDDNAAHQTLFYCDGDSDNYVPEHAVPHPACNREELPTCTTSSGIEGTWRDDQPGKFDCDDDDETVHPDATEICNGKDDDCKGGVDDDPTDPPSSEATKFACQSGKWMVTECPPAQGDCDHEFGNACEVNLTTLANCRECGRTCVFACGADDCDEIVQVSAGALHTCALTGREHRVACWGSNAFGQLGDGTLTSRDDPVVSSVPAPATIVGGGKFHTCAAVGDSHTLYCWGDNSYSQLGPAIPSEKTPFPAPVVGDPRFETTLQHVTSIALGDTFTCAVFGSGNVDCWGDNTNAQLGAYVEDPVVASPLPCVRDSTGDYIANAKTVVAGLHHICSLLVDGTVECWGANDLGQVGDGSADATVYASRPVIGLSAVSQVAAGSFFTCALMNGDVYCWGSNESGQLGTAAADSGVPFFSEPRKVEGVSNAISIVAGSKLACAILADQTMKCWGGNQYGERGDTDLAPDPLPRPLGITGVAAATASRHVCALATGGTAVSKAYCWGNDSSGQLGLGHADAEIHAVPAQIHPLSPP